MPEKTFQQRYHEAAYYLKNKRGNRVAYQALVYALLCESAEENKGVSIISDQEIADLLVIEPRSVRQSYDILAEEKMIKERPRTGNSPRRWEPLYREER